jgi:hypothetical protein
MERRCTTRQRHGSFGRLPGVHSPYSSLIFRRTASLFLVSLCMYSMILGAYKQTSGCVPRRSDVLELFRIQYIFDHGQSIIIREHLAHIIAWTLRAVNSAFEGRTSAVSVCRSPWMSLFKSRLTAAAVERVDSVN